MPPLGIEPSLVYYILQTIVVRAILAPYEIMTAYCITFKEQRCFWAYKYKRKMLCQTFTQVYKQYIQQNI